MIQPQLEILVIAALTASACALLGVFLILRKMAMISDAIGHSILPGIVIGFFITQDLNSPLLIFLAALSGIVTVLLVEYLQKTQLVKEDTAIGLVFPVLFSIGIILISKNAADIHLDIDAVLLGELAFAPFDRIEINSVDMGPKSAWTIGSILFLVITFIILFFKELKISTFDAGLAATLGFSPTLIHYSLMSLSSITIVGAFDAVGAILVVALIIAPAASAYLLTENLKKMIGLSIGIGIFAAISGYWMAHFLDASIAGSIATVLGLFFFLTYLLAPRKGLIALTHSRKKQKREVSLITLLLHLSRHEEQEERHTNHLQEHINWKEQHAKTILHMALDNGLIKIEDNIISLTAHGAQFAEKSLKYILSNRSDKLNTFEEKQLP